MYNIHYSFPLFINYHTLDRYRLFGLDENNILRNALRKSRLNIVYITGLSSELRYPSHWNALNVIASKHCAPHNGIMRAYTKNGSQQAINTPVIMANILAVLPSRLLFDLWLSLLRWRDKLGFPSPLPLYIVFGLGTLSQEYWAIFVELSESIFVRSMDTFSLASSRRYFSFDLGVVEKSVATKAIGLPFDVFRMLSSVFTWTTDLFPGRFSTLLRAICGKVRKNNWSVVQVRLKNHRTFRASWVP